MKPITNEHKKERHYPVGKRALDIGSMLEGWIILAFTDVVRLDIFMDQRDIAASK